MAAITDGSSSDHGMFEDEPFHALRASGRGRPLDVVIWGDSNRVGNHVAELFVEKIAPRNPWLRWGFALENEHDEEIVGNCLRESLLSVNPLILSANSKDRESVDSIARQTHLVIAAAGPSGGAHNLTIVDSCVRLGSDYLDIGGDPKWSKTLADKFDATASENGVVVISLTLADLETLPKLPQLFLPQPPRVQGWFSVHVLDVTVDIDVCVVDAQSDEGGTGDVESVHSEVVETLAFMGGGGGVLTAVPTSQHSSRTLVSPDHVRVAEALSGSVVPLLRARHQCSFAHKGGVLQPLAVDGTVVLCRPTGLATRPSFGNESERRALKGQSSQVSRERNGRSKL